MYTETYPVTSQVVEGCAISWMNLRWGRTRNQLTLDGFKKERWKICKPSTISNTKPSHNQFIPRGSRIRVTWKVLNCNHDSCTTSVIHPCVRMQPGYDDWQSFLGFSQRARQYLDCGTITHLLRCQRTLPTPTLERPFSIGDRGKWMAIHLSDIEAMGT